jgi:hypothetical protein
MVSELAIVNSNQILANRRLNPIPKSKSEIIYLEILKIRQRYQVGENFDNVVVVIEQMEKQMNE